MFSKRLKVVLIVVAVVIVIAIILFFLLKNNSFGSFSFGSSNINQGSYDFSQLGGSEANAFSNVNTNPFRESNGT